MSDKYKYKKMKFDMDMSLGVGKDMDMDMDMDMDIDIETKIETELDNESNSESFNLSIKQQFTCNKHKNNDLEIVLSPPKYNCKDCKKRNICGHSNPNHYSNPFSYLYLVPILCIDCANMNKKCRWC